MVGKFTIHKTYGDIKEAYTTIYIHCIIYEHWRYPKLQVMARSTSGFAVICRLTHVHYLSIYLYIYTYISNIYIFDSDILHGEKGI